MYIQPNTPQETQASLARMKAHKRRDLWGKYRLFLFGLINLAIWIVLQGVFGLWITGLIFAPLGAFFIGWGFIRLVLPYGPAQ